MNDAHGDDANECLRITLPSPVSVLNQDPGAQIDMDLHAFKNYEQVAKAAKARAEEHGLTTTKYEFEKADSIAKIAKKQDEEQALTTAMCAFDSTRLADVMKNMRADVLADQQRTLRSISASLAAFFCRAQHPG